VAVVDETACLGIEECGVCMARCPFDARVRRGEPGAGDGGGSKANVDQSACFGCGICVATCRGGASALERKKGARLYYAHPFVE
jgi:heterodisulfide reductase subunit A